MLTYTDKRTDSSYSIEELKPKLRCFGTIKSNIQIGTNRNGTPKYAVEGVEYFTTVVGDVEFSLWLTLIEDAIKRENKWALYQKILDYVKKNHAWFKKDTEYRIHAAECLVNKSYEAWKGFGTEG